MVVVCGEMCGEIDFFWIGTKIDVVVDIDSVIMIVVTKRQKGKKTKRQNDKKAKRQNDKKTKILIDKKKKMQKHKTTKILKYKKTKNTKKNRGPKGPQGLCRS